MPLPLTVSCSSKIQIGFTFLVPAHLGCPGQRAVKRVCVCVVLTNLFNLLYIINCLHKPVCWCHLFCRNGHIMTHSSKKPYECKFVGCDKSYCDARSLRRHLENHHQQLVDSCSSAASDGILTPRSATDLPSSGQPTVFNFDFVTSPGVAGQNVTADCELSTGLSHSQSSPIISKSSSGAFQSPTGMVWMGGINPLE